MKKWLVLVFSLFTSLPLVAENYLINGGQESQIQYQMVQRIDPAPGTSKLIISYVVPTSFTSPTFAQKISQYRVDFSEAPSSREEDVDARGNKIVRVIWNRPKRSVSATTQIAALNSTGLKPLQTRAPFPLTGLTPDVKAYLAATEQVAAQNAQILGKARELTSGAQTEFDAVQKIIAWVVDHMTYVLNPESYTASYSFRSGKGNCQNYSHLAAALMRGVGIPARIVNGVTLKQPYDVDVGNGILTLRMAQGRHSWIEVYFPDLGWVPFDPQQTQLFVSNRFIRVEVGLDNEETCNDGLIRWTTTGGSAGSPGFEEVIDAKFNSDRIQLSAVKQSYGPQKLLFTPSVDASFTKVDVPPPPPPPKPMLVQTLKNLQYNHAAILGNLEFPQNVDFTASREPAQQAAGGGMEMRKNFMVETAEYVTTQGNQFAQTFILKKPLKLAKTGLALHKFGGDGQLWIELFNDDGSGKPGEYLATSQILVLDQIKYSPGYVWVDFDFGPDMPMLSPGRYWIALGFTGSPIVNWFFSYGKPVGPADGTRYKTIFDDAWSRSLTYEFNYRVLGWSAE